MLPHAPILVVQGARSRGSRAGGDSKKSFTSVRLFVTPISRVETFLRKFRDNFRVFKNGVTDRRYTCNLLVNGLLTRRARVKGAR